MKVKSLRLLMATGFLLALILLLRMVFSGSDGYNLLITAVIAISSLISLVAVNHIIRSLTILTGGISRIEGGDLTVAVAGDEQDELGKAAASLNTSLRKLRELLGLVGSEAAGVSSKTVEIAAAADETSRAIKLIATTVAEIASGAQETGSMAQNAADKTGQVSELAKNTAEEMQALLHGTQEIVAAAESGRAAIERSTTVINEFAATAQNNVHLGVELRNKSQQVREIVDLINTLTGQTNLLALNAAIEAARAGEHGRGFAVVAEEVRKLAEQSRQAAEQINEIVESMLADIGDVVEAFEKTRESMETGVNTITAANASFGTIAANIEKSRAKVQQAALLAERQAQAAADLMTAVHGVAAIAEQSAAATQTTAAGSDAVTASVADIASSTQKLSRLAGNLEQAVFRFHFSNTKTLRVGFEVNDKSTCYAGMEKFGQLLYERTQGRYNLKIFHNAQLGTGLEMIDMLREGTLEMTFPSLPTLAGFDKRFMIFDFPFLLKDERAADKILYGPFVRKLLDMLEPYGFYGLTLAENGFRDMTNSRHAVTRLEDFKGLKIRTMQNALHVDTWKALGAEPVPLPFAKLYNAMRSKEVDGQENPITTIYGDKFYEVQKFLTLSHHVYSPFVLMYSKKLWDTVPDEDKKTIAQAAKEGAMYTAEVNRKRKDEYLLELEKNGMAAGRISPVEMARIQEAVQPVVEKYKHEIGIDFVDEFFTAIKRAEA